MQRLPGKTRAVRALLACAVAFTSALGGGGPAHAFAVSDLVTSTPALVTAAAVRPATLDASRADDTVEIRHVLEPGEGLESALAAHGVSAGEARAWHQAAANVYDLDAVQPHHAFVLTLTRDGGHLRGCDYEIDKYALLSMRLVHGQIQARLKATPQLAAVRGVVGRVESTLAISATAAGVPVRMLSELAAVFGWEVDLDKDVHAGDRFRLVYAELREPDGAARPGDILAAEITSGGRTVTAIRVENERGESEYYDPEGHALGRRFLRYPLDYVAITSQFSGSRMNPVLKRRAPHLGVDFAAPIGTPVRAVASGVVTFAGYASGYGNQVGIDHEAPYASSYSHLRRIARDVRLGAEVHKGQVIGWVGRSGMTTGPHLHFMLFRGGSYVDPLTAALPGDELSGARRAEFALVRRELLDRLAGLGGAVDLPAALSLSPLSPTDVARAALSSALH